MAVNIILNNSGTIRASQFVATAHYDMGDLNIYVPAQSTVKYTQVFLSLRNEQGICEIIELTKTGNSGSNVLYKLSLD